MNVKLDRNLPAEMERAPIVDKDIPPVIVESPFSLEFD